jgi:hypothetical protein
VRAEVQAMLPSSGHSEREAEFLDHMIAVRADGATEAALAETDRTYGAVVEAAALTEDSIARARGAVRSSHDAISGPAVRTMMLLLDQQHDFELFCGSVDALAAMVPKLIAQGDLDLAAAVLRELSRRQTLNVGPWPELSAKLRSAISTAAGPQSMRTLIEAVAENPSSADVARKLISNAGEDAPPTLVGEAIALKGPGLGIAEQLLARRFVDTLCVQALSAQWFQLAPVAARLAREGDSRAGLSLEALMRRPDEQSRREVAVGLAEAGGPLAQRLLGLLLRDPSPEVVMVAARAVSRSRQPGMAPVIAARLTEIDIDNADFLIGRELIAALARLPEPEADEALNRLAGRRAIIKRGRFSEVQALVGEARAHRAQAGGVR